MNWYYNLVGAGKTAWTGELPNEGVDYTNANFLNQFVDSINNRVALSESVGGGSAYMTGYGAGSLHLTGNSGWTTGLKSFCKQFADAVLSMNFAISIEDFRAFDGGPVANEPSMTTSYGAESIVDPDDLDVIKQVAAGDVFPAKAVFTAARNIIGAIKYFGARGGIWAANNGSEDPKCGRLLSASATAGDGDSEHTLEDDTWQGAAFSSGIVLANGALYNTGYMRDGAANYRVYANSLLLMEFRTVSGGPPGGIRAKGHTWAMGHPVKYRWTSESEYEFSAYECASYPSQDTFYEEDAFEATPRNPLRISVAGDGCQNLPPTTETDGFVGYTLGLFAILESYDVNLPDKYP